LGLKDKGTNLGFEIQRESFPFFALEVVRISHSPYKTRPIMAGRKDFLSQPAPENYVAGLGRGATGFTTRSDLGPAREGPTPEQIQEALAKRAALLGAAPPTAYGASNRGERGKQEQPDTAEEDDRFQDPENEVGLFAYGQYDREDDEADRIYQEVDEKMDRRRRLRRYVPIQSLGISRRITSRFLIKCLSTQGSARAPRARRIRTQ
jgi:hypothetical protein